MPQAFGSKPQWLMRKISSDHSEALYSATATRQIEQRAAAGLPPHTLMQRAGLSVAQLTLALAPHASRIWIACGPGNNGGDGFEAALHQWGKAVVVTWTGVAPGRTALPPDAQASHDRAISAGVPMADEAPDAFDVCIDALLGIGARVDAGRSNAGPIQAWLDRMQASAALRICVDVPTGLDADTGLNTSLATIKSVAKNPIRQSATGIFTLSLLTLKPGLFTASGRDAAGEVWFDDLGVDMGNGDGARPSARLLGVDSAAYSGRGTAAHASHKGSFGDVAVLGGESTSSSHMAGAALLAARAALHAGAGRVFVALLGNNSLAIDLQQPELMFRSPMALDLKQQVVVCGCGGGDSVRKELPRVLSAASRLVLDADALNAIASDTQLQTQLAARGHRGYATVLTPHPLEAARLAGISAAAVQASRLTLASELAKRFQCVVVLKGTGTVIAAPGQAPRVNSSGNARLATAGTGDVLAGMVGAYLASGLNAFEAACGAVFAHGQLADDWALTSPRETLTASLLASAGWRKESPSWQRREIQENNRHSPIDS